MALKDNQKIRRAQNAEKESGTTSAESHSRTPPEGVAQDPPILVHDYMMPESHLSENTPQITAPRGRRRRKGKQRAMDGPGRALSPIALTKSLSQKDLDKAWWLDIASPTWEDMRAIGKVRTAHFLPDTRTLNLLIVIAPPSSHAGGHTATRNQRKA